MKSVSKKVAYIGLFSSIAIILGYVEALLPINLGIPGIKLGLANIVSVFVLYHFGRLEAFLIMLIRVILVGLLFGNMFGIIYSLSGGLLSILVMILCSKSDFLSMTGVSILGGVFHNIGQLLIALLLVSNVNIAYYLPVLILAGAVTGFIIGFVCVLIEKRLGLSKIMQGEKDDRIFKG